MLPGRRLLYLSLPGVAFIFGMLWLRRRNKNLSDADVNKKKVTQKNIEATGHNKDISNVVNTEKTEVQNIKTEEFSSTTMTKLSPCLSVSAISSKQNKYVTINGKMECEDDENSINHMFGKSAPINIQSVRGSSPSKQIHRTQLLDCEILKLKIQDAEHKVLRAIDEDFENLSSPIDLPDSVNNCLPRYKRKVEYIPSSDNLMSPSDNDTSQRSRKIDINQQAATPVVITASTTPKVSPEDSFLSKQYTEFEEEKSAEFVQDEIESVEKVENKKSSSVTEFTIDETNALDIKQVNDDNHSDLNDENRNAEVASPSLSLCSAQSGDSGKGCSLPPPETARTKTTYEFFFPNSLVGQLYGRKRSFINLIKSKTNANVMLRKDRGTGKVRICVVEGTENEIRAALQMIRQRLPAKHYPNFTMQRIHFALPETIVPLSTESLLNLQLNLIEGINNDVIVSSIISGGHLFVQHPLHPSHPSLAVLQRCMYDTYNTIDAPLLPRIEIGAVCVLPVNEFWYRVQIIEPDSEETERCIVKFLDFGGYMNVHINEVRQIRSDLMTVPFQATECILSNVEPTDAFWKAEVADVLQNLTKGIILQAQVAGYNSLGVPEIFLFANLGHEKVIFINKELVARGLAKWVDVRD